MLIRSKRIVIRVVTTTMLFVFGAGVMSLLGVGLPGSLGSVLWGKSAYADVVTEHRDNVSFSITEQCLFQGSGAASKTFSGSALNGQEIGGSSATNKFVDEDGAETNVHEFNVSCNVYTGYTVKAYATNLEHQLDFDPGNPDLILFVNDKPALENTAENQPHNNDSYDYLVQNNDTQGYWTASVSGDDTSNTFSTNAANPTTIKLGNTITAEDGDTFSVAYKAYVGKLTPPGSYNGEAVYILASNPTPDIPEETVFQYEIVYNANGGTGLNVTSQSGTAQGSTTITPPTGLVGPEGEEFTGWSKTQDSDDIDFEAGEDIVLTADTFTSYPATLYAVYGNYMQNFTAAKCAATEEHEVFSLTDKRTNASYPVSKLKDGNCWMIQNLYLRPEMTIETQNGLEYELPASTVVFSASIGTGGEIYEGTHIDDTYDSNQNTGTFFNWKSATAGSGGGYGVDKAATDSVCPYGWILPEINDFATLYTSYPSFAAFRDAWHVSLIGYCYRGNCAFNRGADFRHWSSVQYSATTAKSTRVYSGAFYYSDYNVEKWRGLNIRCLKLTP